MAFPYTKKIESIGGFLNHMAHDGKPQKVDLSHLETIGFKSSNDRPLVPLFKALGFINADGTPSERWTEYRDEQKAPTVLAKGIREAYPEIFQTYPDAHRKDDEAIRNVIKAKTDLGQRTVDMVLGTFKALVSKAEFDAVGSDSGDNGDQGSGTSNSDDQTSRGRVRVETPGSPTIAINIQLTLPPNADDETYEKLFAAMNKHLPL